ncbi:PTS sugar transporter subunit IIC [Bifidobacterium imperatoris]|uniref:Permease IIC component n=1 Tax=Bifidobacterium imperatoris TaxID=2020965 RepID=A0A2N5IV07_9BIFI|nr:PTS sugar transporter subunit IIC [Bifidobacterium imperatoris]PLS25791.1 PTS cellobiose transporter subunit IIC [Bifidobacterium imperatoris]QSY57909.1 PTS sugar transporter subunit IIC [Bifidobacterium imperatoris]
MKEKMQAIGNAMLNGFMKFASLKALVALKDGFILTMPATLIGSLFLLLANLPFEGYSDWMAGIFGDMWNVGLNQVTTATFNILAIIVAVGIGYAYARNEKCDGISSGLLSLVAFFIVSPSSMTLSKDNVEALGNKTAELTGIFNQTWTGSNGIISAIIMGLLTGWVYTACIKHNLKIKMPDAVPQGVTNAFSALIPGLFVMTGSAILYHLCKAFGGLSLTELIFKILQIPLQSLTDTWAGAIIIILLMSLLFWCGIHGANVVSGVVTPLLLANTLSNQKLFDAGVVPYTKANGYHYLTPQVIDCFCKYSGVGLTVGLLVAALIFAKSEQMRTVSKFSIVPGIFGINEPVIFGLPIVFNPIMLIPFIVSPLIAMIIMYGAISVGFIAPFGAVQVPWTTPPIISGIILGGWKAALLQVIIGVISVFVYYPFVKMQDKICLEQEAGAAEAK